MYIIYKIYIYICIYVYMYICIYVYISFHCCKLFVLQSVVKDGPKVLDRVNVITLGGPPFHYPNPMLLQPTLGGLCRVTRSLVLLEFPLLLLVSKPPARPTAANLQQCLGTSASRVFSLALQAESSPRIHRSKSSQELHSRIWPR